MNYILMWKRYQIDPLSFQGGHEYNDICVDGGVVMAPETDVPEGEVAVFESRHMAYAYAEQYEKKQYTNDTFVRCYARLLPGKPNTQTTFGNEE